MRRLFGRSHDSASSKDHDKDSASSPHSKDGIPPASPRASPTGRDTTEKDGVSVVSRHSRGKKSVDASKNSDRLSLFGSAFGATIGKNRKPPPRYSVYVEMSSFQELNYLLTSGVS